MYKHYINLSFIVFFLQVSLGPLSSSASSLVSSVENWVKSQFIFFSQKLFSWLTKSQRNDNYVNSYVYNYTNNMLAAKPMIIPFVNISSPTLARSSLPNIFVYQTWVFWYYTRKNHTNILYNVHISINISIKIWDSYI